MESSSLIGARSTQFFAIRLPSAITRLWWTETLSLRNWLLDTYDMLKVGHFVEKRTTELKNSGFKSFFRLSIHWLGSSIMQL